MASGSSHEFTTMFDRCPDCGAGGIIPDRYGKCTNCGYALVKDPLGETKSGCQADLNAHADSAIEAQKVGAEKKSPIALFGNMRRIPFIITFILCLAMYLLASWGESHGRSFTGLGLNDNGVRVLFGLPLGVIQLIAANARRRNIGLPPAWMLLVLVPFVGIGFVIYLAVTPAGRYYQRSAECHVPSNMFDCCPDCGAGGIVPDKYGKCTNCGYALVKEGA